MGTCINVHTSIDSSGVDIGIDIGNSNEQTSNNIATAIVGPITGDLYYVEVLSFMPKIFLSLF